MACREEQQGFKIPVDSKQPLSSQTVMMQVEVMYIFPSAFSWKCFYNYHGVWHDIALASIHCAAATRSTACLMVEREANPSMSKLPWTKFEAALLNSSSPSAVVLLSQKMATAGFGHSRKDGHSCDTQLWLVQQISVWTGPLARSRHIWPVIVQSKVMYWAQGALLGPSLKSLTLSNSKANFASLSNGGISLAIPLSVGISSPSSSPSWVWGSSVYLAVHCHTRLGWEDQRPFHMLIVCWHLLPNIHM